MLDVGEITGDERLCFESDSEKRGAAVVSFQTFGVG
jgi:hypothetical protein